VLANGVTIGTSAGTWGHQAMEGFRAVSEENYLVDIAVVQTREFAIGWPPRSEGDIRTAPVWFLSPGCTGQAYITPQAGAGRISPMETKQGYVFESDDPTDPVRFYYSRRV